MTHRVRFSWPRRAPSRGRRAAKPGNLLPFALFLIGLLALILCSTAHSAGGQVIDLGPDADGFQIWYAIGSQSSAVSSDEVQIGGTIGQTVIGMPDPTSDAWVTPGFWAPGVDYDTTGVDTGDSTDVVISTLAVGDEPAGAPGVAFALMPVQPNPCHGVAYIDWNVPRSARVKLSVYDVQGREAVILADGEYGPGRYSARWNARAGTMPTSGIYFVRLETPDGLFTRRVAIVR